MDTGKDLKAEKLSGSCGVACGSACNSAGTSVRLSDAGFCTLLHHLQYYPYRHSAVML